MPIQIKRHLLHWFAGDRRKQLSDAALQRLTEQVARSEQTHSGEIRICVESRLPDSYLRRPHAMQRIVRARAVAQFSKLRVWDTEHNNGVLIYLQLAERSIEIVADRGIDRLVGAPTWQTLIQALAERLRAGQMEQGLADAVNAVSALLQQHFPLQAGEVSSNELPNAPVVD